MANTGNVRRNVVNVKSIFPPTNSHSQGIFEDVSYQKPDANRTSSSSDVSTIAEEKVGAIVFHSDASDSDYEVSTGDRVSFQKSLLRTDASALNGQLVHTVHASPQMTHTAPQVHARVKTQPLVAPSISYTDNDTASSVANSYTTPKSILKREAYKPDKRKAPAPPPVTSYTPASVPYTSNTRPAPVEMRKKRAAPPPPVTVTSYLYNEDNSLYRPEERSNSYKVKTSEYEPKIVNPWMPTSARPNSTFSQAMSRQINKDMRKSMYSTRRSGYSEISLGSTIRQKLSSLFTRKSDKQRKELPGMHINAPQPNRNLHNFTFVDSKIFNPEESSLDTGEQENGSTHSHYNNDHNRQSRTQQVRPTWWDMKTINAVRSDIHQDVYLVRTKEPVPDY